MKRITNLFLIIFLSVNIYGQIASDCTVPLLLKEEYGNDVKNMALRRMYEFQSPDTSLVKIPQAWQDTIIEGLAAILNVTGIPERDSVFNLYCVHDVFNDTIIYKEFLIKVDTSYTWTDAWHSLITLTGDTLMDTILTRYHLYVDDFYHWGAMGNYALLATDSSWNIYALMDSLKTVPGVLSADVNLLMGDGSKIDYDKTGDERFYDFWLKWGDCMDGCSYAHVWHFKVNSDCSVEYLGYEGDTPYSSPLNCNIFVPVMENNAKEAGCYIFPNPNNGNFEISIKKNAEEIVIYNSIGAEIYNKNKPDSHLSVDLSRYGKGMYFVGVRTRGSRTAYEKVIVQ